MFGLSDRAASTYKALLESEEVALEKYGARHAQLARQAAMIDQKASSMLTYLAILLAGVSIFLVGADETSAGLNIAGVLVLVAFVTIFTAAFLFLSCARLVSVRPMLADSPDELMENMYRLLGLRYFRFQLGFRLTIVASALFAVLVGLRLFSTYF